MYRNKKKIMIGILCIVVLIMVVVYAAFNTRLTINGTGNITSTWNIEITSITSNITGTAYNIENPTYNGTNATFNAGLIKPGDKIEYNITVTNNGSIDAIINTVDIKTTGSYVILYTIEGIQNQERLASKGSKTFKIIVEFDREATSIPNDTTKEIIMNIECIQDDGQSLTPSDPNIDNEDTGLTLVQKILRDNTPQSDESIDFSKTSEEDGTKGLYYTNTNTEDGKTVYYYRGAVENNYVKFAGYYWRIIRINEDGSIRLIYQGETPNAMGSEATIGDSAFNKKYNDNAYVGYMYGTPGSDTYEETHENINDSTIKTVLDTWYEENLLSYASYIADSGFCGDRSIYEGEGTGLGYGKNLTYYQVYNRYNNTYKPQFSCPQSNDLYTTSSSNKGNKALDYPVGLITIDEVLYVGGRSSNNESYYLYIDDWCWTMSPVDFDGSFAVVGSILSVGRLYNEGVVYSRSVRPVINLKSDIGFTQGDGTGNNPYLITE